MKIKTIVTASSALVLAGCFSSVLWTSAVEESSLTGSALPIAAQGNVIYQLYPVDAQLHLRKLDSAGVVQWQTPVDESLANALTSPKLRANDNGVVVGYQDGTAKTAFVKSFDGDGNTLWSSNLGDHASENLNDMTVAADGSVTVALRFTGTTASIQRYDNTGALQWETPLPACNFLGCVTALALDDQNGVLAANGESFGTRSYLLDSNGTQLWYRWRATGLTTAGIVRNPITASASGFTLMHPFVTWHFDRDGNETWNIQVGSLANVVTDATGNFFVPGAGKISKLDATGVLQSEIDLTDQAGIRQLEWREDLQRLIVLTTYDSIGPEIDGTITAETGMNLSVYDETGVRKTRYRSKASQAKSSLCSPYPQCTNVAFIPGESWSQFAITTDKKLVVSGLTVDSQRFAKAYKLP